MDLDGLSKATQQSVITRLLANMFLFAVLMTSLGIGAMELVNQGSINPIITTILGTGIGMAAHAAGINQGVVLQPLDTGNKNSTTESKSSSVTSTSNS